jgi:hypothetical protein
MPDTFVPVPFAKQETLFYCGPATLQMVLSSLGVAAPAAPPSWQTKLWADVQANTGATRPSNAPSSPTSPPFLQQKCESCQQIGWRCWATTPSVLAYLANGQQGVARFSISQHSTEESATGVLMTAIDKNLPAVSLVRGWLHWLVVEGYRHSEAGATPVAGRNLNGVYLRDPLETSAIRYVKWKTWKRAYLKFIPCGEYAGSFIVIDASRLSVPPPPPPPSPPPPAPIQHAARAVHAKVDEMPDPAVPLPLVKKLLPESAAIGIAREGAAEFRGAGRLREGFDGADATKALLVQRLDAHDQYYYIVTFTVGGRETARVIVDAHDGELSEVSAIPEKGQALQRYMSAEEGRSLLLRGVERLSSELRFQLRTGTIGTHPVAVWKPCRESMSPFLPFWQYSIGDSFVYFRFDGERFEELTEGPA